MASPVVASTSTPAVGSGTTLAVTKPAGVAAADRVVLCLLWASTTGTPPTPTCPNFVLRGAIQHAGGGSSWVHWAIFDSDGNDVSAPASYTVTWGVTASSAVVMAARVTGTSGWDGTIAATVVTGTTATAVPAVTTTVAECRALSFVLYSTGTESTPSGWTEAYDTAGGTLRHKEQTAAGSTGASTSTHSVSTDRFFVTIAYRPPVTTVPTAPLNVRPDDAFGYGGELPFSFDPPASDGGAAITGYRIGLSTDDEASWTTHTADTGTTTTAATLTTGITNGTRYMVRVAAINSVGVGPYAVSEWGCTPIADAAPATPPSSTNQTSAPWQLARIDQRSGPSGTTYAHRYTGAGVRVYMPDSGVRITHNEFDTATMVVGFSVGATPASNDIGPAPDGHGTLIASCVGGVTYGPAKEVTIVAMKVFEDDHDPGTDGPYPTEANLLACLDDIATNHPGGPAIVSLSCPIGPDGSAMQTNAVAAIEAMVDDGFLFVLAAGNDSGVSGTYNPPKMPGVIIVAGCNTSDAIWSGTSRGPHTDIFGPAENVGFATAASDSATGTGSGTSEAAPIVAGVCALWLEANPNLTPRQLKDLALASSTKDEITGTLSGSPNRLIYSLADLPEYTPAADYAFLGDVTVTAMFLGDTPVDAAYLGDVQIF